MSMPLKWEFPGGKVEEGESCEACLRRELFEELAIHVDIVECLPQSDYSYPSFTITLYPFICTIRSGEIVLGEHAALCWLHPADLLTLDWAEADIPVVRAYCGLRYLPELL
jgi:8-oxo-dGTP diphosphatase